MKLTFRKTPRTAEKPKAPRERNLELALINSRAVKQYTLGQ